jgi:cellulose synthase/poly-beta-1,6-N-acetylglucosamine synthase-like glycosyltransferase
MTTLLWVLLTASAAILWWIYDGYGRILQVLAAAQRIVRRLRRMDAAGVLPPVPLPTVTVLLTVHNEAAAIVRRLQNILNCDYPAERLRVLVASDGSTDATESLVRGFADDRVKLFCSPGLGKTATQNLAITQIESEVIVFTDADIEFSPHFLTAVVTPFADPQVGAVDGRLLYGSPDANAVQAGQGFYWNYELKLRRLESDLGLLAVVAGACFALRRSAFVPMDPAIGEDCIVPLDVARQGLRVVHATAAVAHDEFDPDSAVTLRRRIRMTLRNWQGTWSRAALLNPLQHPGYAFALWSHKLLRWLSPVFLLTATVASVALLIRQPGVLSILAAAPFAGLFGLAGCGWLLARRDRRFPGAGAAYSFLLANTAFLIGLWRALAGQRVHSYRNR